MTSKHGRMLINAGECSDMAVCYASWLEETTAVTMRPHYVLAWEVLSREHEHDDISCHISEMRARSLERQEPAETQSPLRARSLKGMKHGLNCKDTPTRSVLSQHRLEHHLSRPEILQPS
jgi:hypothetical protein